MQKRYSKVNIWNSGRIGPAALLQFDARGRPRCRDGQEYRKVLFTFIGYGIRFFVSELKLIILAWPSLSGSHASGLIQVIRRTPELWFQLQRPWFLTCDAMWSILGKATPLDETYTFQRGCQSILPIRCCFRSASAPEVSPWCSRKQAYVSPPKWTRGSLSSGSSSGRGAKKDGCFWWLFLFFECSLSWLLTTGVNKGWLWEDRSAPSVSDVFMPGWGNWMAAECSHAGPSHPNQRLFFFFFFRKQGLRGELT